MQGIDIRVFGEGCGRALYHKRYRTFTWFRVRGQLLTNALRADRGLQLGDEYSLCIKSRGDILHVLRDCYLASSYWERLVHAELYLAFMSSRDHVEWIE